jgi:hypothetical protein
VAHVEAAAQLLAIAAVLLDRVEELLAAEGTDGEDELGEHVDRPTLDALEDLLRELA